MTGEVFFTDAEAHAVLAACETAEAAARIGARCGLGDAGSGIHVVRVTAAEEHLRAELLAWAACRLRSRLGMPMAEDDRRRHEGAAYRPPEGREREAAR